VSTTIRSVQTAAERRLETDATGRYSAPALAASRVLDVTLPVASATEVMVVEESPSPVTLSTGGRRDHGAIEQFAADSGSG
jgi:hypothetical protein